MQDLLNVRVLSLSNSATAVNLDTIPVIHGWWIEIVGVSVFNTSGETVSAVVSVVTGAEVDQILPTALIATSNASHQAVHLTLGEGQKLRAAVTGIALTGSIGLLVFGYYHQLADDE